MSVYLFESYLGYIPTIHKKLNISLDEVKDAYSDALVKLIHQIKSKQFRGESRLSSYFYRIFFNTAVDVSRKKSTNKNVRTEEFVEYNSGEKDVLRNLLDQETFTKVKELISEMGESCQTILLEWGYWGYSMKEIAQRNDYNSAESVRSLKYKCLKKLRGLLELHKNE